VQIVKDVLAESTFEACSATSYPGRSARPSPVWPADSTGGSRTSTPS